MKKYVVKAAWDENKWVVESHLSGNNSRIVGPLPEGEDPEWLQLENIEVDGQMVPTLTVDETKKAQVLAARSEAEFDKAEKRTKKQRKRRRLKRKIRKAKREDVTDLESIKDRLDDLTALVKELLTTEEDENE